MKADGPGRGQAPGLNGTGVSPFHYRKKSGVTDSGLHQSATLTGTLFP